MSLDLVKTVVIVGGHLDQIPLLLEAAGKVRAAENAVQVVDAVVPVQYAVARIVDEVRGSVTTASGDLDTELAKVCAAYNAAPPAGVQTQKLLTIENLRSVIELVGLIAALFPRK